MGYPKRRIEHDYLKEIIEVEKIQPCPVEYCHSPSSQTAHRLIGRQIRSILVQPSALDVLWPTNDEYKYFQEVMGATREKNHKVLVNSSPRKGSSVSKKGCGFLQFGHRFLQHLLVVFRHFTPQCTAIVPSINFLYPTPAKPASSKARARSSAL